MSTMRRLSNCCRVEVENNHCIRCGKPSPVTFNTTQRKYWSYVTDNAYPKYTNGRVDRGMSNPKPVDW